MCNPGSGSLLGSKNRLQREEGVWELWEWCEADISRDGKVIWDRILTCRKEGIGEKDNGILLAKQIFNGKFSFK